MQRKIAFTRQTGTNWDIYTMNSAGRDQTRLTFKSAIDSEPSLSPGASTIHFESTRDQNTYEIYRMDPNGSVIKRLTFNSLTDSNPG
jgi:Tol biopolymer transport system component